MDQVPPVGVFLDGLDQTGGDRLGGSNRSNDPGAAAEASYGMPISRHYRPGMENELNASLQPGSVIGGADELSRSNGGGTTPGRSKTPGGGSLSGSGTNWALPPGAPPPGAATGTAAGSGGPQKRVSGASAGTAGGLSQSGSHGTSPTQGLESPSYEPLQGVDHMLSAAPAPPVKRKPPDWIELQTEVSRTFFGSSTDPRFRSKFER